MIYIVSICYLRDILIWELCKVQQKKYQKEFLNIQSQKLKTIFKTIKLLLKFLMER